MSLFEIKCPMCKGTLWIDPATGKVVDHKSTDQQKVEFDAFLKAQKNRDPAWDEKFKKARDEEAKRKAELDQKFKQAAKEGPVGPDDKPMSPFEWD